MKFHRRAAVPAPASLRGDAVRRDGDLAVRRRRKPNAGDPLVPRGLGATGRQHAEYQRGGEPRDSRTVLLQGTRTRFSGADGLRECLHPGAAEHRVAESAIRTRRGRCQGNFSIHVLLSFFFFFTFTRLHLSFLTYVRRKSSPIHSAPFSNKFLIDITWVA